MMPFQAMRLRSGSLSLEAQVRAMLVAAGGGAMFRFGTDVSWSDTGMTTNTALSGSIAALSDLSGFGNHNYQSTGTSQGVLVQVGGYYAGRFDGVDDFMRTNATFDIKAGGYLACASQYPSGASPSSFGVIELCVNSTNYFRLGQVQTQQRSFAGERALSASPSSVNSSQAAAPDSIAVNTPYVNSAILSSTGLTVIDSTGTSTTNTNAPFGANVVPAATGLGVKLGFSSVAGAYAYQETIFGAVFCPDYTKIDDTIVRAWLKSISGAA